MLKSMFAIALGAVLGAWLRWGLSLRLNHLFPTLPPGTWVANLVGGYLIGLAIAWFAGHEGISVAWRLFIVTGFCGALTTFSTFSAEVWVLLQQGRLAWAFGTIAAHVAGSLAMTAAGFATVHVLAGR
ncbi:fluoride efflux transporter CrcB [Castellaniella sp. GW247-6E4]|uniref:fluoride efflux transporter CrcB n=1 Tax=Castellaniella sp. GW247-6E4 TaxID=3140380 RepID=UPI003314F885